MMIRSLALSTLLFFPLLAEPAQDAEEGRSEEAPPPAVVELRAEDRLVADLLKQIDGLRSDIAALRQEVAQERMRADRAERELEELRQFIADRREFGDDFQRYREIRETMEREARRRQAEENRARDAERRDGKPTAFDIIRARKEAEREREEAEAPYRRAGMSPLGLDVYIGRVGFFYKSRTSSTFDVEYHPHIGDYLEPHVRGYVDYSRMTISGSILNASDEVRNIGAALAFFDRSGNQVGAETIEVSNARPNVPYPFTSTIDMALDGPFATTSSWVLYADAVETEGED